MIITLDHQSTSSVPNHVVVHGTVLARSHLADGSVKANAVLDDVMNPVVRNFSTWGLTLHDLHHGTIRLQMPNIPHFVVEDLGRITNR